MNPNHNQKILVKELCRQLRKQATGSEKIFWEAVRDRRFENRKFYRQHPIFFDYFDRKRFFIADFYCHEEKLVVELDGKIHDYQKDYDEMRDHIINDLKIKVLWFKNEEIENNLEGVLERLRSYFNSPFPQ